MRKLYLLYDSHCGICSRLRTWIAGQAAYVPIEFVAAGSSRAIGLFPELRHDDHPSELIAITDEGEVYADDAAWIVCLYALVDYRVWSFRLARGPMRRLARTGWELLSKNRGELSRMLALQSDAALLRTLQAQPPAATACTLDQTQ